MGLLTDRGGGAFWPPLRKIRHKNPTMMKLGTVITYLGNFKQMHQSRDTPLGFCLHQHFSHGYNGHMVTILMMSAKITTRGLLKIKVFRKNGYDVIISVHDVTNKILSRDSNYIIDVVM